MSAGSKRTALPTSLACRLVNPCGAPWGSLVPVPAAPWGRGRCAQAAGAHSVSLTGDILACINGVSIEGFGHKQIVDLIKSSGNYLRWVPLLQMGFGPISPPLNPAAHSPALPERQKSQGLGWESLRASITCSHRLETVNGALFLRKMELETRLQALKVMIN